LVQEAIIEDEGLFISTRWRIGEEDNRETSSDSLIFRDDISSYDEGLSSYFEFLADEGEVNMLDE